MKKQKSNKSKMGFSLIELSIVILVIGILVIGITKGGAIMSKAKIGSARALTNSSPVLQIADVVAWYETSLESSFPAANAFDQTAIDTWSDNSKSSTPNDATGSLTARPLYQESALNSLPTVRFDGVNDLLSFNAIPTNQKDYTIFVVETRRAATSGTAGRFLGLGVNNYGYASATTITGVPATATQTVPAFVAGAFIPRIITILSGPVTSSTRGVFMNGGAGSTPAVTAFDPLITSTATGTIGAANANFYTGDISEVIIYSRALKLDERNDIQTYLGKKYGITVTTSS